MKKIILIAIFISATLAFISSCKKAEMDSDTQSSVDNTVAENSYSQVFPTVNQIVINEERNKNIKSLNGAVNNNTCATVTISDTVYPVTITIDYGAGCTDFDGKTRKGIIKATVSSKWDTIAGGSTITVELINYYENDINIQGTLVLTNNGNHSYTRDIINGKCVTSSWTIEYDATTTLTWLQGFNTDTVIDDIIEITGTNNGINRKGIAFTTNIIKPLIKDMSCKWISEGIIEITPKGKATRTVDFGDGTCDNEASVTINGKSFKFNMK